MGFQIILIERLVEDIILIIYVYSYLRLFVYIFSLWAFFFFTMCARSIIFLCSRLQIAGISFAFDENIGTRLRVDLCLLLFASLV